MNNSPYTTEAILNKPDIVAEKCQAIIPFDSEVDRVVFYENSRYYCIIEFYRLDFVLGVGDTAEEAVDDAEIALDQNKLQGRVDR